LLIYSVTVVDNAHFLLVAAWSRIWQIRWCECDCVNGNLLM